MCRTRDIGWKAGGFNRTKRSQKGTKIGNSINRKVTIIMMSLDSDFITSS